ncbi:MAG: sigma-54 dependent transcriptional regulator [Thermodesulfobacteriota bacterium]|nr:sigma-54 dependent transcriptional regulator [Thermodesulfobacteriota bacterium]
MKDILKIFFSNSSKMNKLKTIIGEIAKTDITVLIKGESGTGKELVAEAIHFHSPRHPQPFIKVNCAAIPKGLLESELFGFEKGAFTGAYLKKPGKFELANGGTILLNEISDVDISIQAKLLQVLQDGGFSRLGGDGDIRVNTRVIATTKDHLEKSVNEGNFREDLFFRINVISLTVPPLRDRKEQIHPLSQYFFNLYKTRYNRSIPSLSSKVINLFKEYHWPGNIRELENLIKRAVIFGDEEIPLQEITRNQENKGSPSEILEHFSFNTPEGKGAFDLKEVGKRAAEIAEREIIKATLQETHWNRKEAARLLQVSYKALLYKIQKYNLQQVGRMAKS